MVNKVYYYLFEAKKTEKSSFIAYQNYKQIYWVDSGWPTLGNEGAKWQGEGDLEGLANRTSFTYMYILHSVYKLCIDCTFR